MTKNEKIIEIENKINSVKLIKRFNRYYILIPSDGEHNYLKTNMALCGVIDNISKLDEFKKKYKEQKLSNLY